MSSNGIVINGDGVVVVVIVVVVGGGSDVVIIDVCGVGGVGRVCIH